MHPARPLSLVITTYDRPDALAAVVRACFMQDDKNFEIIIADDGSAANTAACIERLARASPVPLRHVWQPDQGFRAAMARNRGILAARGDYLVFLDGDCIPQRDFIARHRALARPGWLVSGSRILMSEALTRRVLDHGIDVAAASRITHLGWRLGGHINKVAQLLVRWPDIGRRTGRNARRFNWRRIKSCNLAVWRSDLARVNGFDESFTGWGYEDSDLVLRLFHAGVLRTDGAFATEVFHLWHREAGRDRAASNRQAVLERAGTNITQAVRGLREHTTRAGTT
jgi:glycosyltransferase involved in cell wall biosynthesis